MPQSPHATRWAVCVLCVVIGLVCLPAPRVHSESKLVAIFDLYDRGRYSDAIAGIPALGRSQDVLAALQHDTMPWIRMTIPTEESRRSLVAATVALEIARTNAVDYQSHVPIVSWACEIVRHFQSFTPPPAERAWYLASIAVMDRYGGSRYLIGKSAFDAVGYSGAFDQEDPRNKPEWETGHLSHAQARFPNESWFRLKRTEALEATTYSIRTPSEGNPSLRFDAIPPDYRATLEPIASGKSIMSADPTERDLADMRHAVLNIWLYDQLPRLVRDFTELAKTPAFTAEAELHLGHLKIRVGAWDDAISHLARVPESTTDPRLLYLGAYMRGWAEQRRGHIDEAVRAYRAALQAAPHAQSAAVLLSSALVQIGESTEAYNVLDQALKEKPAAADPWDDFHSGEWPRLSALIDRLREALR